MALASWALWLVGGAASWTAGALAQGAGEAAGQMLLEQVRTTLHGRAQAGLEILDRPDHGASDVQRLAGALELACGSDEDLSRALHEALAGVRAATGKDLPPVPAVWQGAGSVVVGPGGHVGGSVHTDVSTTGPAPRPEPGTGKVVGEGAVDVEGTVGGDVVTRLRREGTS